MNAVASQLTSRACSQEIVLLHYPMVRAIACRIYKRLPKTVDLDDLISTGVLGLLEAVDRYDESRSVPFDTYAKHRIRGAIVDSLRASDWVPRSVRRKADLIDAAEVDLAEKLGRRPTDSELADTLQVTPDKLEAMRSDAEIRTVMSLDAPTVNDGSTPLVEQIASGRELLDHWVAEEQKEEMIEAIRSLPERERTAIALYYLHELSLKEVGTVLGVTESRACQLCGQAIKRLQKKLGSSRP